MYDVWLRKDDKSEANGVVPWRRTVAIDDERNPDYHFKIQGDNGIVSVRTGQDFRWKLVVIPSEDPKKPGDSAVGFFHENNFGNRGYMDKFLIDCETGESTFQLVVEVHGHRCHLMLNDKDGNYPIIVAPKEHKPIRRAGLVDGVTYYTFGIGQKW